MPDISERHEIRIRGRDHTIVFIADSQDGRLVIRQEPDGKKSKEVCAITLSDPDELRAFFKGLRRILSSLGHAVESGEAPPPLAESGRVWSRAGEKKNVTPSLRRLVKGTRKHSCRGRGKKSKKSADVIRRERASKQSLVYTKDLPARSSSGSSASVYRHASKNIDEIS